MPLVPQTLSADAFAHPWQMADRLFLRILEVRRFLGDLRWQMRYGELSRAPLQLLRFEIAAETAECEWVARRPDLWDGDISRNQRAKHSSQQAIFDAMNVRRFLFAAFPELETVHINVFRVSDDCAPERIIAGIIHRSDQSARGIHSVVMRARVLGFRFKMTDNILEKL